MKNRYPKKFVGLHSHSTFSIGDAIGMPQDHIDFAIENEMDALALTDHGNMNGYTHQFLHNQKLHKNGQKFKAIPGIEAYFIDSLADWKNLYLKDKETKSLKKLSAGGDADATEALRIQKKLDNNPFETDKSKKIEEDMEGGTVVEDEDASKKNKHNDPLKQRNHLVLLPKNIEGLESLFQMVSRSYIDGFYRFPRMDFDMLKKFSNGNIIATSACIGGQPGRIVFGHQTEPEWDLWSPNMNDFEEIQNELKEMVDKFKWALGEENYYLELQFNRLEPQHLVNQHLIECSKRTGTPLVVTTDAHYSNPKHWKQREIYKMMAWASKGMDMNKENLPKSVDELKCELYPKNASQIWDTYLSTTKDKGWDFYDDDIVREAIERTYDIAHDQIDDISPDTKVKLPSISYLATDSNLKAIEAKFGEDISEESAAFQELKRQAIAGMKYRRLLDSQEHIDRLKEELKVVKHLKFSKYFLTYSKIMENISSQMLCGLARGSAAGSLLSYVLNITQLDPIKYGLLFERFLTRFKKGFPDIDSDFADRDKAVKIIAEHFGEENVIPVSNFNQLQLRSLVKDLCKLDGVPFEEVNNYTKKIEAEALAEAKKNAGFDRQGWVLTYDVASKDSQTFRELMNKFPELETNIKILFKQMRNVSRHAGGVIITEKPEKHMPIIKSGGVLQTPWQEGLNFRHLENLGFLKFDILGLGTLRIFENTVKRILKNQGIKHPTFEQVSKWFYENVHPDNNTMDDPKVYKEVYEEGKWAGIFQFVQSPVQKFVMKMKPKNIIDLATATSIFRPGPLGISADKLYLKNRAKPEEIAYKHPLLKEVLGDTYGLIVFQEQLQLIYNKLAGVPLEETDGIRKAFMKKDMSNKVEAAKERLKLREFFADKCLEVNDIPKSISYSIFEDIEKFIAYSFNKSHAVSYTITSYQCAWLLTYYPDEWTASYIDYCAVDKGQAAGRESPVSVALGDAKGIGYKVGKPDINTSDVDYQIINKVLIPSFQALKHVGVPTLQEIREYRPYTKIEDLVWNPDETWRHSKFNKKALSTLIKLEAFSSMDLVGKGKTFKNYRQMHYVLVDNGDKIKRACARKKDPQPKEVLQTLIAEAQELDDWTLEEKINNSQTLAGSVDINLIIPKNVREYLDSSGLGSVDEHKSKHEWYWCVVKRSAQYKTRNNKPYLRMKIFGESGRERDCFIWGYNPVKDFPIPSNTLVLAKFEKSDFGLSTFYSKIEVIDRG